MKKGLFVCMVCLTAALSYNAYAEVLNGLDALDGCEDDPRRECRVFVATPDGGTVIKEPGINKMSIEAPEDLL